MTSEIGVRAQRSEYGLRRALTGSSFDERTIGNLCTLLPLDLMHPYAIFTNLNKKESERLSLLSEPDIKIQEV